MERISVIPKASLDVVIGLLKEQIDFVFDNLDQYEGNAKDRIKDLRVAIVQLKLYRYEVYGS